MARINVSGENVMVNTSFNGDDVLKPGEIVFKCVCGVSFIGQSDTQTCVSCGSIRLEKWIHHRGGK